ncbi:hypothetical protein L218DRAFT_982113 [Marasmius fiardii PR-910]|nr:hypothetical protein L218DRAFT_982113 [Marasmius fiardii PR-910]
MVGYLALLPLAFNLAVLTGVRAAGPETSLIISNMAVNPDGFQRNAVVVNSSVVGPVITGQKGDTFKINVVNNLNDPEMERTTTIHWHGLTQDYTNWADGTASVTQCPIAPGAEFLYEFNAHHAGTFWYHSHLSTQYCDGLRGAFVVYDPEDPHRDLYDVDDESTVISLTDWYHTSAKKISTTAHFG